MAEQVLLDRDELGRHRVPLAREVAHHGLAQSCQPDGCGVRGSAGQHLGLRRQANGPALVRAA